MFTEVSQSKKITGNRISTNEYSVKKMYSQHLWTK